MIHTAIFFVILDGKATIVTNRSVKKSYCGKLLQEEAIKKYLRSLTIMTCTKWYDFNDLPLQKLWKAVFEDKFSEQKNHYSSNYLNLFDFVYPQMISANVLCDQQNEKQLK